MKSGNTAYCLVLHFVGHHLRAFKVGNSSSFAIIGFLYFTFLLLCSQITISLLCSISQEVNVAYLGAGGDSVSFGGVAFVLRLCRGLSRSGRV